MGVSLCDLVKKISMILGVGVRGSKRKPSTFRPARRKKKPTAVGLRARLEGA